MLPRTWTAVALSLATACSSESSLPLKSIPLRVVHENREPAADVRVEALDEDGGVLDSAVTDINGGASLSIPRSDSRWSFRLDRRVSFFGVPAEAQTAMLASEYEPPKVSVTFRPVLTAGDTWFQPLADEQAEWQPYKAGQSLTLRLPGRPRKFFVVAGNQAEGVRHAARLEIDGSGDVTFTDPIGEPFTQYGQRVEVSIAGLSQAPLCVQKPFPTLTGMTAALVYPKAATGLTVYAFTEYAWRGAERLVQEPMTLRCTFVEEIGECAGANITGVVPLSGLGQRVTLDWSKVALRAYETGGAAVLDAHVFHDGADQAYLRDKGGFCMLPHNLTQLTYLDVSLALAHGKFAMQSFLRDQAAFKIDQPGEMAVTADDGSQALLLQAACSFCYQVAVVTGTLDGHVAIAYVPMRKGLARVPRTLFDERSSLMAYGYAQPLLYGEAITLPMQGYSRFPGGSKLIPVQFNGEYYEWSSRR